MIKYKIYIKALLFILLAASLFGFANQRNDSRKILKIEIDVSDKNNLFITKNEVEKMLIESSGNLKNQLKENITLKVIEAEIERNSMVKKAEVFLTIEGVLKINVLQRVPIARILVNNTSYYLDEDGDKMKLSKNHSARVPIVKGVTSRKELNYVYRFITEVLEGDEFMKNQIIGIHIKAQHKFDLKTRMGNQLIEFGGLENAISKVNKLKAFYQKMDNDKSLNKYKKINLVYNKQVVCTK